MPEQIGLRERKKEKTRQQIAQTSLRLFFEHGFDNVTVAEVARAAEVSEKTVFNYFPTKEDLVYWRLESFEEELLTALRNRGPGEPLLAAFGRFVLARRGLLAENDPAAIERLVALTRMITESPALLVRERQIFEQYTGSLAALIDGETSRDVGEVESWAVASAMIGIHRALVDFSRRRILEGVRNPRLSREVRLAGEQALAILDRGLGGFAPRR